MQQPMLSVTRRIRSTPFTARVNAAGVKAYTVYNHMLLATVFESVEADYRHLKNHVQVWDVSCERQVEIHGPDAAKLTQMLTPRNLAPMTIGQCWYTPMVDETGGMVAGFRTRGCHRHAGAHALGAGHAGARGDTGRRTCRAGLPPATSAVKPSNRAHTIPVMVSNTPE